MMKQATLSAMALEGSGQAPTELRIFKPGWTETTKGKFLFDEKSASAVLKAFQSYGNRLVFDYDHAMVKGSVRPQDKTAAANFAVEVKLGDEGPELWAVDIQWTANAKAAVEAGEWLYFSPTFYFDEKSRRVDELVNVALTNLPATIGMTPLVAAGEDISGETEPEKGAPMKALFQALGLREDAQEDEAISLVHKSKADQAKVLELTKADSLVGALGVIQAGMAAIEQAKVLSVENEALKAEQVETQKAAILQANERKFNEDLKAWASKQSLEALSEFVKVAPDLVPAPDGLTQPAVPAVATLTEDEKRFAKLLGNSESELAKFKADEGGVQ